MMDQATAHIDGNSAKTEQLQQELQQYFDKARTAIEERPVTVLFTAVVAGFALGRLVRR